MTFDVTFDPALIRRYDETGPRYTSYPTAVAFHEGFDEVAYRRHARLSNSELIPRCLSLYLHLPFCHSLCYYCGCNKKVTRHPEHGAAYLERLEREIAAQGALFDPDREVRQLHLGGGTPTFFDDDQLERLVQALGRHFNTTPRDAEWSIEIDPRTVDDGRMEKLAALGFNRYSLGIQDTDPAVQQAVNRVQSTADALGLVQRARALGAESVSIDLIYGLPLQSAATFSKTLEAVIAARPDRLSVYNYAHLPERFRAQRLIREEDLPSAAEKLDILALTIEQLTAAGYRYIGMDHFALPDSDLARAQDDGTLQRNFQGYSTHRDCDLVGIGVSAIGRIGDCFAQNLRTIPEWSEALDQGRLPTWRGYELTVEDRLRADVIETIMCHGHLAFDRIGQAYQVDFTDYFAAEIAALAPLAGDGLVDLSDDGLEITAAGRLLVRHVAMVFDAHLARQREATRYSKVI